MAEIPQTLSSDPTEMFALGRRHLAVKDYSAAASCLAKACELLAEKHGQQADECGEACFWYGKALLSLARQESGVLGDGLPGNDETQEDEEEDDENGAEDNQEADNTNEDKTENSIKEKNEDEREEQKMEVGSSDETSDNVASSSSTIDQPGPSSGVASSSAAEGESVENEEDEVENLQLAWEVFEIARDIFLKRGERGKKELADVYLLLGEVSLESEVYEKAISDMGKSLELFNELYNDDDRRIAETHYQIGLAHSLSNGFDDAVTHFKCAVEILEKRISNLKKPEAQEDENLKKKIALDPFYTINGEIRELTELLPEIREKIQDTIDYKAEAIKSVRESLNLNKTNGESSKTNGCTSSQQEEKKASDISHLIKRKRKPEEDSVEECSAPKKPAN